jgi:thymidylate synthase (FAD)
MTVEVVTPLAISIQALRHSSLRFQQFSGRYENQEMMAQHTEDLPTYADVFYLPEEARLQDTKNRQNSVFVNDGALTDFMWAEMEFAYKAALQAYRNLIDKGICKEQARFVLPEGVYTRLYMKGSVRSFIHYLAVREDEGVAQHEHVELARCIRMVFATQFPVIYKALFGQEAQTLELDPKDKEITELKAQIQVLKAQIANKL